MAGYTNQQVNNLPSTNSKSSCPKRFDAGPRSWRSAALLWTLFCLGLLLQAFSSNLRVEHNAFVMPPVSKRSGAMLNPEAIVARERKLQAFSGLLVLSGALGLSIYYRRALLASFTVSGKR